MIWLASVSRTYLCCKSLGWCQVHVRSQVKLGFGLGLGWRWPEHSGLNIGEIFRPFLAGIEEPSTRMENVRKLLLTNTHACECNYRTRTWNLWGRRWAVSASTAFTWWPSTLKGILDPPINNLRNHTSVPSLEHKRTLTNFTLSTSKEECAIQLTAYVPAHCLYMISSTGFYA